MNGATPGKRLGVHPVRLTFDGDVFEHSRRAAIPIWLEVDHALRGVGDRQLTATRPIHLALTGGRLHNCIRIKRQIRTTVVAPSAAANGRLAISISHIGGAFFEELVSRGGDLGAGGPIRRCTDHCADREGNQTEEENETRAQCHEESPARTT